MKNNKQYYNKLLKEDEVIPLFYDSCFKLVFGDPNHLERLNLLLSTILNKDVKVITLLNNDSIGDNRHNKRNTFDLVCQLDNEYVSIEVNSSFGQTVIDRNLLFLFRLGSKELHPGADYGEISKYYQINLNKVNFDNEPFNICHIKSTNTGKIYTDIIEIININVLYYAKICYTMSEEELSNIDKVLGIIGTDKKSVIDKIAYESKMLKEMGKMVKRFSSDDDIIFEYNREKLMMEDMKQVLTQEITEKVTKEVTKKVTKEVTKEVTKRVTESNTKEIAKKLKEINTPINNIVKATGLTKEEIEKL